jgi:hypothetical protein
MSQRPLALLFLPHRKTLRTFNKLLGQRIVGVTQRVKRLHRLREFRLHAKRRGQ